MFNAALFTISIYIQLLSEYFDIKAVYKRCTYDNDIVILILEASYLLDISAELFVNKMI